jgi:hypothetical protein
VLPAIEPAGSSFEEAVRLRDAARAVIRERCDEPDAGRERVIFSATGIERIAEPEP